MRRLLPLPDRTALGKRVEIEERPLEAEDSIAAATLRSQASHAQLKSELNDMKSELAVLEREELVHHQSQLQVAQERLRTKRRSDLAKRMQEAQRLQVLRERKAELDDTRKSKLVDFKKRMISAAERALEHESLLYDVLYDNIGDALNKQMDLGEDGMESVVFDEDAMSTFGYPQPGDAMAFTQSPQASPGPPVDFSLHQPHIPSLFEEHLKIEQAQFASQLRALRHTHSQSIPADPRRRLLQPIQNARQHHVSNALTLPTANALLPYLATFPTDKKALPTMQVEQQAPSNSARFEHQKLRDELRRLLSQDDGMDREEDKPVQAAVAPPTATKSPSSQVPDVDATVTAKVNELEVREAQQAAEQHRIEQSTVPFEDMLHKGVPAILENAEANNRARAAVERAERERMERAERQQRSASLFGSVNDPETLPRTRSSAKTRRVSMLIEGEATDAPATTRDAPVHPQSPVTVEVGSFSAVIKKKQPEPLPVALAIVSNVEEREQLIHEQQMVRFMTRRAVQRDELSGLQRKLQELMLEAELHNQKPPLHVEDGCTTSNGSAAVESSATTNAPTHTTLAEPANAPLVKAAEPQSPSTEELQSSAARTIQCSVRCMFARRQRAIKRGAYDLHIAKLAAERRAADLLAEKTILRALNELEMEYCVLESIEQREVLVQEGAQIYQLIQQEARLNRAVENSLQAAKETSAATRIQSLMRGVSTRVWYRAVLVARQALIAAAKSRSASLLQRWYRGVVAKQSARNRCSLRRGLFAKYHHVNVLWSHVAATCVQRVVRHYLSQRRVAERRQAELDTLKALCQYDAAVVIQRQWRKHEVDVEKRRIMVGGIVDRASTVAGVMSSASPNISVIEAAQAATTIAAYTRRYLLRDEWRKRWLARVFEQSLQSALGYRQEMTNDEQDV